MNFDLEIILLSVLLIIILTIYLNFKRIKDAISGAVLNKNAPCGKFKCDIIEKDLALPPSITDYKKYSKEIGKYSMDLIGRIENSVERDDEINIPKGLVLDTVYNLGDKHKLLMILKEPSSKNNRIWIIFRGSKEYRDWMEDFKVEFEEQFESGVMIHKGFNDFFSVIKEKVTPTISKYKSNEIIVAGHSLGAALSTLFGLELKRNNYNNIHVYNFGSPRIGNLKFKKLVDDTDIPIWRHVNTEDVIPTLPLPVTPDLEEPSNPFVYTHCGTVINFSTNWGSLVNNHTGAVYIDHFK